VTSLISFQKPDSSGWRWSMGYRCRRNDGTFENAAPEVRWTVQRWNGSEWELVGGALEYGGCRELATADREERAARAERVERVEADLDRARTAIKTANQKGAKRLGPYIAGLTAELGRLRGQGGQS
jgi:hypothetical protein